jgi:hypothetical protein
LTVVCDGVVLRVYFLKRLWLRGPTYQGSTEGEEEDEAVTEVVTGVVIEVEEGDTVLTGGVAGTWIECGGGWHRLTGRSVGEDAAINYYFLEF